MHRRTFLIAAAASGLLLGATPAMAIEEPDYQVVRTIDDIEIRDYASMIVAEIEIAGAADDAGSQAFPILAGYIFGKNKGERKFAMTAPVVQTEAPVRLPMTAPVTQAAVSGGHVVQFVLPRGVTLASAPEPLDARVHVREMAPRRMAVIRYAGLWSEANYAEHLARLKEVLASSGLEAIGAPIFSRYNAPFTPWFLRRNEIWMPLAKT
jgi:SOUL heme-binding protein